MPIPNLTCVILWAVILVGLVVLEASTANLVSIWFAVGALAALLVSIFTPSLLVQGLTFAITSAIALIVSKPFIDKARHRKPTTPVGLDRNIGRRATVLTPIVPGTPGRVRLDGVDWSAVSQVPLQPDDSCIVRSVNSNTLTVEPADKK